MHFASVFLLPLLVAADQVPLQDMAASWLGKAKSFLPSGSPDDPIDALAAGVAGRVVERINVRNWQRKLAPQLDMEQEWMIYITGGNKSCFGRCGLVDEKWNESIPLLIALPEPAGAPKLRLGRLDCEKDEVVCTAWACGVPSVYHFTVPKKSEPQAKSPLHIVPLNLTTATVADITSIPAAGKSRYLEYEEYTGIMHPIDGTMVQFGLMQPFGYFMWGLGTMPSWVMMIGISFFSRQIMSRRMGNTGGIPTGPQAQAQQPASPPPRVAPAAAAKGGSARKRK